MDQDNVVSLSDRVKESGEFRSALDELFRQGAQRMLQAALEAEVSDFIERMSGSVDDAGHRQVVRNGSKPEREIQSGVGPVTVKQPRVHDKSGSHKFTSAILPPYLRRSPSIEALIPALYLRGVSTNGFTEALAAILGPDAAGLSSSSIERLKKIWEQEYAEWLKRDLSRKHYVYLWADGIYFNVRLTSERPCVLVLMGATADGKKELIALLDGERESKLSWTELFQDIKRRGLTSVPKLAIADGALGFWPALEEEFPATKHQRCWVHKTANVLDKMPKKVHPAAKNKIHEMYMADTRENALAAYDEFMSLFEDKYPKACQCLQRDKDVLFTFYEFPAAHWIHIRTTNPIESAFATVRHRTRQTKGCGSRMATLTMVFKLATEAEKRWRRLNKSQILADVIRGVKFKDGVEVNDEQKAA